MAMVESISACAPGGAKFFDLINQWPVERPPNWIEFVDGTERESELEDLRSAAQRGRPFGAEDWMMKTAEQLGLIVAPSSR
jgi:putative transposase